MFTMNYRHGYHAGNFADVFKHVIVTILLEKLGEKNKPFCYIDTHAGAGCYNLAASLAQKTREYCRGVSLVLNHWENLPREIVTYGNILKEVNVRFGMADPRGDNIAVLYPGSPLIGRYLLRKDDNMLLMELNGEEVAALKQLFKKDPQVAVHHYDGYLGLKAFLPPIKRRGLVLIDAPFENRDEFATILSSLNTALTRWPGGIYAIWYPLKIGNSSADFMRSLGRLNFPYLDYELIVKKRGIAQELIGCGMAIVNPPWLSKIVLNRALTWLEKILA